MKAFTILIVCFLLGFALSLNAQSIDADEISQASDAKLEIERMKEDIKNTMDPDQRRRKQKVFDRIINPSSRSVEDEATKTALYKEDRKYNPAPIGQSKKTMSLDDKKRIEHREKNNANRSMLKNMEEKRSIRLKESIANGKSSLSKSQKEFDQLKSKIEKEKSTNKLTETQYQEKLKVIETIEANLKSLEAKILRAEKITSN